MVSEEKPSEMVTFCTNVQCTIIELTPQQNPSFVLRAVRDVAFEDRPVPTLRGPKDVRVHIAQTGICGSDVRYDS
jgi:hypothetical protein